MSINPSVSDLGIDSGSVGLESKVLVVTHYSEFNPPKSVSGYVVVTYEKPNRGKKINGLDQSIKYVVELPYTDWEPPVHSYNGSIYFVGREGELIYKVMFTSGDDPAEIVQSLLATRQYVPIWCRDWNAVKAPTDSVYKPNMVCPAPAPETGARPIDDPLSIEGGPRLPVPAELVATGQRLAAVKSHEFDWSQT